MSTTVGNHIQSNNMEYTLLDEIKLEPGVGVSRIIFEDIDTYWETYDILKVNFTEVTNTSDAQRLDTDLSDSISGGYTAAYRNCRVSTRAGAVSPTWEGTDSASKMEVAAACGNDSNAATSGEAMIFNWGTSTFRTQYYMWSAGWDNSNNVRIYYAWGMQNTTADVAKRWRWYAQAGNIDGGNFKLYGHKRAV